MPRHHRPRAEAHDLACTALKVALAVAAVVLIVTALFPT